MGIFDRLKDRINAPLKAEIDLLYGYLNSMGGYSGTLRTGLKRHNNRSELTKALHGFTDTCLTKITDATATTNFIVYKRTGQGKEDVKPVDMNHWAQRLLDKPNPYFNRSEVLKIYVKWYYVNGNGFMHSNLSRISGKPVSLWVLPSPHVGVKITEGGNTLIDGFTFGQYANNAVIPPNEVIHIRNLEPSLDPMDMILGKSIVFKAIDDIDIEYETKEHLKRWFENDTNPPMVWETPNTIQDPQWQIAKARWDKENPNLKLRGLLEGGTKISNVASGGMEIKLDVLDLKTVRSIASTMGISADYILYGSQATRASMETMMLQFMTDTIEPLRAYLAECFTNFIQHYETDLVVRHEPYVYKDANEARLQESHDMEHGVKTIDDIRTERGLAVLPNGQGQTVLVKQGLVTLDSILNPPEPIQGFKSIEDGVKKKDFGVSEEEIVTYWKKYDKIASKYSDVLQAQIAGVFEKLGTEVLKSDKIKSYKTKADGELFDVDFWKAELVRRTGKQLNQYMITVIENALKDVSMSYDDLSNEFDKLIQKQLALTTEKITTSVDTVKDDLEKYLKDNKELTIEELTTGIHQKFTHYSEGGAKRIAQTTSNFAKGAAKKEAWGDVGFKRKWLTERDGKVRPSHEMADGQLEDSDGMFSVGGETMAHPCGGGIASNNINCRCDSFPVKK